ncbi:endo-arabinase [Flavobacterium sp. SUN052]|uniref:endo-arabinase n=1 Tax=Flavobacterium sp. SUN052 TaxID=3002441 RepID=UPI00237DBCAB|nr:endo-arabinase [Flavobacterium sp. SUN052]MEC4003679.1 endo-arabinase [Flavobacterium sp. SUN052]
MKKKSIFLLILVVGLTLISCQSKKQEENAIKELLKKEAQTWRNGNFKGHSDCWQIQPYSKIIVSLADGTTIDVPPTAMTDPKTKMGNGGNATQTNFNFKINKNDAWVSHEELSTDNLGVKTFSYEIRLLEKINNQWKLVGQSIHIYNPKKLKYNNIKKILNN